MATLREAVKALLAGDGALAALLTGGVLDADALPMDGGGVGSLPLAADGMSVRPFAVLRWRGANPREIVAVTERRTLEVYVYQERGYGVIEQAKRRIKSLLIRQRVSADDAGIAMFHWLQDMGELPAEEFGNLACEMSRFYVDYVRR